MIILDKTVISSDVTNEHFVCDLNKCKGACCVEGDLGAPLEEDELDLVDEAVPEVLPYLSEESKQVLENEGAYLIDEEGDFSTTTLEGKECVFAYYDDKKVLKCGIEQAYIDGKVNFQKPTSCHLYPIRIQRLGDHDALNYDRWAICSPACELGESLKVPVYKFLKDPLIRKYGKDWYNQLTRMVEDSD